MSKHLYLSGGEARIAVRNRIKRRDNRDLVLKAVEQGAEVKETRSGVLIRTGQGICSTHGTPTDRGSIHRLRADLRRIGALA